MADRAITLEKRDKLPKQSWDLPRDEIYFSLGCSGCANAVCFTAKGARSVLPEYSGAPEDTTDLMDITRMLEKTVRVHEATWTGWDESCSTSGDCPDAEAIEIVVGMLNERFNADLTTERTE